MEPRRGSEREESSMIPKLWTEYLEGMQVLLMKWGVQGEFGFVHVKLEPM